MVKNNRQAGGAYKVNLTRKQYEARKKEVEEALREYPYNLISVETPGLGSATRWDVIRGKDAVPGSSTEKYVEDLEVIKSRIDRIEKVLALLNEESKTIIELVYFRDTYSVEEILIKLNMSKNKYYKIKNKALEKFILAV